jgi:hypothetical protein
MSFPRVCLIGVFSEAFLRGSRYTPRMTPDQFIAKWKPAELKERAACQEHFLDLCRLVGQPTPAEADPKGEWYTFECDAERSTVGN